MDLDAYIEQCSPQWRELEALVNQRSLTAHDADQLIDLYERVSTHLSVIRSTTPDPTLVRSLSNLLARARRRAGSGRVMVWSEVSAFFAQRLPAALYQQRWWWLTTMVVSVAFGLAFGTWVTMHPELLLELMSAQDLKYYTNHAFKNYYSSEIAREFAFKVWVNNAWVAAQVIAFGITGFMVLKVLFDNVVGLALAGAAMHSAGHGQTFWGLILPHGLVELTAVFMAAGVGLRLFWSWVRPGPMTRLASLARAGRSSVVVVMGLAVVLAVSGFVEAFVTPSGLPTVVRVGIGVVLWLGLMYYALIHGRAASLAGADADLSVAERGEDLIAID